jgi:hypothetical protein
LFFYHFLRCALTGAGTFSPCHYWD